MFDTVIIRYGEIFLKSEYVKNRFEDLLAGNIERRMASAGISGRLERKRHRLYVKTPQAAEAAEALKTVFGIVSLSPAQEVSADKGKIVEACEAMAKVSIKPKESFAVRAERAGKHDYSSKDVEKAAGEKILGAIDCRVNLDDPDRTIFVEIRDESAYLYDLKIKGPGGMPYRSQGKVVSLLSTGIDSPAASWMMMRRGCSVVFLHLGEEGEVDEITKRLSFYAGEDIKTYNVPYDAILAAISAKAGKYTCVVCKRFMHRLAEKVMEKEGALGIVSGENIGQVASQTLDNLKLINCLNSPVYRPLVAMDKEDIIKVAKDIGTYELAQGGRCKYVPDKPSTQAREEIVKEIEAEIGIEGLLKDVAHRFVLGKG